MENEILTGNVTVSDKNPFLKTCLYYGWPSAIGGSVSDSVNIYKTYDIVVFGDEYEHPAHEDYANTQLVFNQLLNQAPNIKIFGYVLIGDDGPGLPDLSTIQSYIQEWKTLGATGIFLDCYGYDYQVTRERQNTIVSYCHINNLNVIANAWTIADVFSSEVVATYNPNGIAPVINSDDFMLLENLFWTTKVTGSTPSMDTCIEPSRLYDIKDYQSVIKSGETMPWKQRYGTKMIVLDAIPSNASLNDYHKFATVSLIGSAILNLDGIAIGDENWGASESGFYQDWTWPYNLDLYPLSNTAFTYTEKTVADVTFISTFSNTINSTLYTVTLNYANAEDISYSAGKVKAFQAGSYIEDAWNMASDDLQVDVKYKNEVVARLNSISSVILNTDNKFVEQNITVEVSKFNRGIDPSDATATAADIITGKTAYIAGGKTTGTLKYYDGTLKPAPGLVGPDYLCFTATSAPATITTPAAFEYSTDNCTTWTSATAEQTITLTNTGDKVYFRHGNAPDPEPFEGYGAAFQIGSGLIAASGDLTTLLNNNGVTTLTIEGCFINLFLNCKRLVSAPSLPATTVAEECYTCMFQGCTNLTTPPALPATTLADGCYTSMFQGCTSLTTLPALPALDYGYTLCKKMFYNCSSIKVYSASGAGHTYEWRIPTMGTGTKQSNSFTDMLTGTGGDVTGAPAINTIYYVENAPIS